MAPKLQVRIKTHKTGLGVSPPGATAGADLGGGSSSSSSTKLMELIQIPNTYNMFNSTHIANDLTMIKLNKHHKHITLDIKDLFTNIPIIEIINITKQKLKYNHLTEDTATQYTELLHTILTQYYFTYDNKCYTCNKGVAMGHLYPVP